MEIFKFSSQDGQISPSLFLCMCFCRLPILLAPYKTQTYTTTLVNNAYLLTQCSVEIG